MSGWLFRRARCLSCGRPYSRSQDGRYPVRPCPWCGSDEHELLPPKTHWYSRDVLVYKGVPGKHAGRDRP